MLIQFTVRNFKTFREKATFSQIASNYDKDTRATENITEDSKYKLRVLKSAVVYGANASGKSRFIEALKFMKEFVINSSRESQMGDEIPVQPFRLNTESENEPSEFEVIFTFDNIMYRYGFEVDRKTVVSEWLYYKPKSKEVELFHRDLDEINTHPRIFQKGATLIKGKFVRDNALILSVASQFNEESASNVLSWFRKLNIISGLDEKGFKTNSILKVKNVTEKGKVLELLKVADLGIVDVNYKQDSEEISAVGEKGKLYLGRNQREKPTDEFEYLSDISTYHKKFNEDGIKSGNVKLSMNTDESEGTKKFFYLAGPIIDALENGGIIVADDLDSKIHPNLVAKIVSLFNSNAQNPKNAQLIFNTHDTNLLGSGLFRKDQVWFIEKDKYGEASLFSLADFKSEEVRKTEAFEDNYIRGKYGAIPFLGFFDNITINSNLSKVINEK